MMELSETPAIRAIGQVAARDDAQLRQAKLAGGPRAATILLFDPRTGA